MNRRATVALGALVALAMAGCASGSSPSDDLTCGVTAETRSCTCESSGLEGAQECTEDGFWSGCACDPGGDAGVDGGDVGGDVGGSDAADAGADSSPDTDPSDIGSDTPNDIAGDTENDAGTDGSDTGGAPDVPAVTVLSGDVLFDNVVPGTCETLDVLLQNDDDVDLDVRSIGGWANPALTVPDDIDDVLPIELDPGEQFGFPLTYCPTRREAFAVPMFIVAVGAGQGFIEVPVTATLPGRCLEVAASADTVDFGARAIDTQATLPIELRNCGPEDAESITVSDVGLGPGSDGAFRVVELPEPLPRTSLVLEPGDRVTVTVGLTPDAESEFSASLQIASDAGAVQSVELVGSGAIDGCPVAVPRCSATGGAPFREGVVSGQLYHDWSCDASASFDPDGTLRDAEWSVFEGPRLATARIEEAAGTIDVFPQRPGRYVLGLDVVDDAGNHACGGPATIHLEVLTINSGGDPPFSALTALLLWQTPSSRGDADLDLHVRAEAGTWGDETDLFDHAVATPAWADGDFGLLSFGAVAPGAEAIIAGFDGVTAETRRVGAHVDAFLGVPVATEAAIVLYSFGRPVFAYERNRMDNLDAFWDVATVTWPDRSSPPLIQVIDEQAPNRDILLPSCGEDCGDEQCDDLTDNDGDGSIDEDCCPDRNPEPGCRCRPGRTWPCGTNTGACERGLFLCDDDGVLDPCIVATDRGACSADGTCPSGSVCVDEIRRPLEDLEDDCTTSSDPTCVAPTCRAAVSGEMCADDGGCDADSICLGGRCRLLAAQPIPELCNGLDDDCDGRIDDDGTRFEICGPCPFNSVLVDVQQTGGGRTFVCVDQYEASRPDATADDAGADERYTLPRAGVVPWTGLTADEAEVACGADALRDAVGASILQPIADRRLCRDYELAQGCGGTAGTASQTDYPYGDTFAAGDCVDGGGDGPALTGSLDTCCRFVRTDSIQGDQSVCDATGNVAEWVVGAGAVRQLAGGSYLDGDAGELSCVSLVTPEVDAVLGDDVGFRCCTLRATP